MEGYRPAGAAICANRKRKIEQVKTLSAFFRAFFVVSVHLSAVSFLDFQGIPLQNGFPFSVCYQIKCERKDSMLTLDDLINADRRPEPYEPGEELWNDPHISRMMLEAHLSPDTDAASYRPEKIKAICEYLIQTMGLKNGDLIVDLGCGPGLYCSQLVQKGFHLTGIDRSENSIHYAKNHGKDTNYILASYLNPFGENQFDAALMISQDYGVLSPENREILLGNIRNSLKPNGYFAFDVSSMAAFQNRRDGAASKWYVSDSGFWRPHKHFVLEKTIIYSDFPTLCDFVTVFDSDGIKAYHIYQTFFSPESICSELEKNGFRVEAVLSNLYGERFSASSLEIGVICRKI